MSDYFRKYKSLFSSTSNSFGTGEGETITPNSVSGLPTDTEIVLTFDRVDSGGTATPTKLERVKGTISGGNLSISSGGRGYDGTTEQAHTSPVVEQIWNAADWNDLITGLLVEHQQTGLHKAITTSSITASLVTACQVSSCNITASAITGVSKFPKVSGLHNNGSSGSAVTINWLNGDRQRVDVTASTTISFSNAAGGQILTLFMHENGTGGYSITLPTMQWPASTVTTWTTTACAVNSFTAMYDATASKYFVQGTANYGI